MTLSSALLAIRWLIHDTFRQSLASSIFWVVMAGIAVVMLVCLSIGISGDAEPIRRSPGERREYLPRHEAEKVRPYLKGSGVQEISGEMALLFGVWKVDLRRTRHEAVRHVQLVLASTVGDTFGVLLALICTAGFLPSFLEPGNASVLLGKPVPRWSLLAGKYLGVLLLVLVGATIFVLGTWAALGLRTAVWDPLYLLSLPVLVLHFAIFFSFSTMLAVWTRSTIACILGTLLFWGMCWGMNYGHHAARAMELQRPARQLRPEPLAMLAAAPHQGAVAGIPWGGLYLISQQPPPARTPLHGSWVLEAGYWLIPKPADMGMILYDALEPNNYFVESLAYRTLKEHGAFHPMLSIFTSLLFTVAMLAIAGYEFMTMDY